MKTITDLSKLLRKANAAWKLYARGATEGEKQAAYLAWERLTIKILEQHNIEVDEDDFSQGEVTEWDVELKRNKKDRNSTSGNTHEWTYRSSTTNDDNFWDGMRYWAHKKEQERREEERRQQERARQRYESRWYEKEATSAQRGLIWAICTEFNLEYPGEHTFISYNKANTFINHWKLAYEKFKKYKQDFQKQHSKYWWE